MRSNPHITRYLLVPRRSQAQERGHAVARRHRLSRLTPAGAPHGRSPAQPASPVTFPAAAS